jgi:hypothetical protein
VTTGPKTYPLIRVGRYGHARHVMRDDQRPLCEVGRYAENPHPDTKHDGHGVPTCARCIHRLEAAS